MKVIKLMLPSQFKLSNTFKFGAIAEFNIVLILTVAFVVFSPVLAFADCTTAPCNESNWNLIIGGQYARRTPSVHYIEKSGSPPREIEVDADFTEKRYLPFPFMQLEYRINPVSYLNLTYNRDSAETSAIEHKTVKFLFFPIHLAVRTPLKIDMQSLKLNYNRALYQGENLELGGTLGVQTLKVDAKADIPFNAIEKESVTEPLPNGGLYATYRQDDRFKYHLQVDYLPLDLKLVKGSITEVDFKLHYLYSRTWEMGVGYRYTYMDLELDRDSYHADVSYKVFGPTVFVGANF